MSEVAPPARFRISMILAILIGLAYVAWLAWAEGWRLWVVLGVMVLIAAVGGAVHMAMGLARARDGLEGGDGSGPSAAAETEREGERAP